jgi:hypothetical protein
MLTVYRHHRAPNAATCEWPHNTYRRYGEWAEPSASQFLGETGISQANQLF